MQALIKVSYVNVSVAANKSSTNFDISSSAVSIKNVDGSSGIMIDLELEYSAGMNLDDKLGIKYFWDHGIPYYYSARIALARVSQMTYDVLDNTLSMTVLSVPNSTILTPGDYSIAGVNTKNSFFSDADVV